MLLATCSWFKKLLLFEYEQYTMVVLKNVHTTVGIQQNVLSLSNHLILVRLATDAEPIPGAMGMSWEYTVDGMSGYGAHTQSHY